MSEITNPKCNCGCEETGVHYAREPLSINCPNCPAVAHKRCVTLGRGLPLTTFHSGRTTLALFGQMTVPDGYVGENPKAGDKVLR